MTIRIEIKNLGKQYRLGEVGTGTISHDLNRWWAKIRGKEDPFAKVGEVNDRTRITNSDYVWALQNINLEIKEGDILGVIGRNGAGKSTLLKILSRITKPSTGEVKINGRIGSLLEVGTGMHPELTGRDNIFLNGSILGMTRREIKSKFDEIVEFAGIAKYVDTPIKRYSSGMQVRLGFAVAAFLEPEILIVDEVLAVGDVEFQKKAIGKMQSISRERGRTVLFVSHNLASIRELCNSALLLDRGEKLFLGTSSEAIERYIGLGTQQTSYVVNYLENREKAIGNNQIKIYFLYAKAANGSIISISSGIVLELIFFNKIIDSNLALTVEIKTLDDIIVLHHGFWICERGNSQKGVYTINMKLQPNLLNAGVYKVSLILATSYTNIVFKQEELIKFEVQNESLAGNSRILPGVIRPEIEYSQEFDNE